MKIIKDGYFDRFRCLAAACPDSCCHEWDVLVDEDAAAYYRCLSGPLGDRLRQVLTEQDGVTLMAIENGRCPMWRQDGLCRIQAELGEAALCKTCREFPRLTHDYGDFIEYQLELSCPEAARLILTLPPVPPIAEEDDHIVEAEYDKESMAILLQSREYALYLLDRYENTGEALAVLLIYGYHVQGLLDGAEDMQFDPDRALQTAKKFARGGDAKSLPAFFLELEILTDRWKDRLAQCSPAPWNPQLTALCRYLIRRYWLQAISDGDLICRMKLIIVSCLMVRLLGGNLVETAQLYSKEIENNIDNVEAVLDATYTHSAFTDDKLLWLLLDE